MGYRRISKYYPGCDGTKLAVDLYLPETQEKVPVLFNVGYEDRRRSFEGQKKALERFLEAHYAICLVEPRGHGASSAPQLRQNCFWGGASLGRALPQEGQKAASASSFAPQVLQNAAIGFSFPRDCDHRIHVRAASVGSAVTGAGFGNRRYQSQLERGAFVYSSTT